MAAQLEEYQPDKKTQQLQQAADLIKRNGSNLLRLINQLLDLSKIEAGEMHLQPVRADLVGFARYIGESFQSMAKSRNIGLHFLWEEKTCEADFDRDKLGDVLTNLLSNALKFTPAGGHVSCRLKRYDSWQALSGQGYHEELTPTSHLDNPWIRISVGDTGPGIEPGSLPKVFDRFFQADHPPAAQTGGTGIGLALVRELVLLMHGGLAVRNLPDQGAEFVVSLPHTGRPRWPRSPCRRRHKSGPRWASG
jgi:signal transduction histidine kinase